jgi:hypothetical protein
VLLLASCSELPEPPVALRFVDLLPDALVHPETLKIDFGGPGSQSFLLDGWSLPEGPAHDRFVWAVGKRTSIRVFLTTSGSRSFVARCEPFRFPGAPLQSLSVLVGGERVASIPLDQGLADYHWEIPNGVLRAGDNRIDFEYTYAAEPALVTGTSDRRALAVAWHELRMHGGVKAAVEANPAADGDTIVLPFGQRVDFFVRASGSVRLDLAGVRSKAPDASLRVSVEGDRIGPRIERQISVSETHQSLALKFAGADILRVSLLAVPGAETGSASGVRVVRPLLYAVLGASSSYPGVKHAVLEPERVDPPDVLIYAVDTLRADHLGVYGYDVPSSPHIDEFARDSVVFENARATSSWTRPSVASILTGLHPFSHGVAMRLDALPEKVHTLAEILRGEGYATGASSPTRISFVSSGWPRVLIAIYSFPRTWRDTASTRMRLVSPRRSMRGLSRTRRISRSSSTRTSPIRTDPMHRTRNIGVDLLRTSWSPS